MLAMNVVQKHCDVCGANLNLSKDSIYQVQENVGISYLFYPARVYDATDCPCCGCQNILKERYPKYLLNEAKIIEKDWGETENEMG